MFDQSLKLVKAAGEDFEWYPTTDEILGVLISHLKPREWSEKKDVLDVGAGNGKVLDALAAAGVLSQGYAIEKSTVLVELMAADHVVLGTDFHLQSLYDKQVEVVFCNPPYSEFSIWADRLIREASAEHLYLVLPCRWKDRPEISQAMESRKCKAEVLGSFDFQDAEDRRARAKVDLLYIWLGHRDSGDPFDRFFDQQFKDLIGRFAEEPSMTSCGATERAWNELVARPDFIPALVTLYDRDLQSIQDCYDAVSKLGASVLRELEIGTGTIKKLLKKKLSDLKISYWRLLFEHMSKITSRLTTENRRKMLDRLQSNSRVDFTTDNILAIVIWAVKNSNDYTDSQLIAVYEKMVEAANVFMYKSNARLFVENIWRYDGVPVNTHYGLETRVVVHRVGGISTSPYKWEGTDGLKTHAYDFVRDLLTVANNLGFFAADAYGSREWKPGVDQAFHYEKGGKPKLLMKVRAYKNQNLHIKLAQDFALALNVEHGRLKGWLHSPAEAAEELKDPKAAEFYGVHKALPFSGAQLLLAGG